MHRLKKLVMVENQEFHSPLKIGAHHYAELFARNGYEVLWLSPAYSPLHYLKDKELVRKRRPLHADRRIKLAENIYGYAPFTFMPFANVPFFRSRWTGDHYLATARPGIAKALERIGFGDVDILWISNIKAVPIKKYLRYKTLIYRLADEKTGFKNYYRTLVDLESELMQECDILFATARALVDKAKQFRDDVIYLPNGVNSADFETEDAAAPPEWPAFKGKKVCLYIGAIAEWIDRPLVSYLLKQFPNVAFVFIGPDHGGLNGLESFANLHLLGKRDYRTLPNYLAHSDAAIIPFEINKLTDAISPVKLFEYMAAGCPTVTTGFKEVRQMRGPFDVATGKEGFAAAVYRALNTPRDTFALKAFAKRNDWSARFSAIIRELDKTRLPEKKRTTGAGGEG